MHAPRPATTHPGPPTGLEGLEVDALLARGEPSCAELAKLLQNARYWRSFEIASFEPLLRHAPTPLAELGVGVLLRFGEDVAGRLEHRDLDAARAALAGLPAELEPILDRALATLGRGVATRNDLPAREGEGFRAVRSSAGVSAFALRASGSAAIEVEAHPAAGRLEVPLGVPLTVRATDERGRPLPPPDVSSKLDAPVWLDDRGGGSHARRVLFAVPGPYVLQVPGRAGGARTLVAS